MSELRNPAQPFCQNWLNLDETIISNEDSEEEYHTTQNQNCILESSLKCGNFIQDCIVFFKPDFENLNVLSVYSINSTT